MFSVVCVNLSVHRGRGVGGGVPTIHGPGSRPSIYYQDRRLSSDPVDARHFAVPLVAGRLNYRPTPVPCAFIIHSDLCYAHLC